MSVDTAGVSRVVAEIALRHQEIRLVVLFGSRARGDQHRGSDYDLGYLADTHVDPGAFLAELVTALGTDHIDLVDLDRASGLVRYRAARDGIVVFEAAGGAFERFWLDAVTFWCDAQPVLRAGYEATLERLPR